MRFLPTVDIWNPATAAAVRSGQIKLQRGQWLKCGDTVARFVCLKAGGRSIWAAHPTPNKRGQLTTTDRFKTLCEIATT